MKREIWDKFQKIICLKNFGEILNNRGVEERPSAQAGEDSGGKVKLSERVAGREGGAFLCEWRSQLIK